METGWGWQTVPRFEGGARLLECGQATAQTDHTEVALQADAALTLEQWTLDTAGALLDGAGVRLVTNLQLEQCFQAIAQVFSTLEAQGVVGALADGQGLVRTLGDACVNGAVDLNCGLCLCNTGECAQKCHCQK